MPTPLHATRVAAASSNLLADPWTTSSRSYSYSRDPIKAHPSPQDAACYTHTPGPQQGRYFTGSFRAPPPAPAEVAASVSGGLLRAARCSRYTLSVAHFW